MGCVSSAFLEEGDLDGRRRIISAAASQHQHIVSLTSSTYGILAAPRAYYSSSPPSNGSTAAPPPPPLPPPPPPGPPATARQQPPDEVINSWELMAGLVDPSTPAKTTTTTTHQRQHPTKAAAAAAAKPPRRRCIRYPLRPIDGNAYSPAATAPPAVVLFTTSLRGVRATFEACNAVRAALQAHGVAFRERDVSMDRGFREELRELVGGAAGVPRLLVRGRLVGGAEEVLRLEEEGALAALLEGLPRARGGGGCCDGCGGVGFLPCFDCHGSRKVAVPLPAAGAGGTGARRRGAKRSMVVRCGECNENGLVLCPICC